jgi:hypothetical protein
MTSHERQVKQVLFMQVKQGRSEAPAAPSAAPLQRAAGAGAKTVLQTGGRGVAFGYAGVVDGLRTAVAREGLASLWRGLLPRLLLKSLGSSLW